ncbi:MAG: hypothetical protein ABSH11_14530 [Verrucomicrobiota bacterium]|jgi:hypothetical protein
MPAIFEAACHVERLYVACGRVKQLVADFRANEKFHLSPAIGPPVSCWFFMTLLSLSIGFHT